MASSSSFQNPKDLKFVITLAQGKQNFISNGSQYNTITLQGLMASVFINNGGAAMMGTLSAQIFGLTDSQLNALTSPQWLNVVSNRSGGENQIQVYAIDGSTETLVYNGYIVNAWGVYTSMPEVYLYIQAQVGFPQLTNPSAPLSIASDTTIGTVMGQIATAMGFNFVNNGVSGIVPKGTYLANTLMEQAFQLMEAGRFWMYIDNTSPNTLAIAPYGKGTNTVAALVSPETGLIGYPMFNQVGINFDTLFNPNIIFGGYVEVKSSVANATGSWIVNSISHQLSSQTPGGPWQSTVFATTSQFPTLLGGL